jgi:HK97 family phage major capsid protein
MPASLTATNRLEWLTRKRDAEVAEVTAIAERATSDDRDLSDEEQSACQRRREAVERLDREITVEVEAVERQGQYEQLAERIGPALRVTSGTGASIVTVPAEAEVLFRSPGEYLATYLRARKDEDADAVARIDRYRGQLLRANQVLASNPGLVPEPIVGPVVQTIDARRPAIAAATTRPMPSGGKSFTRPIVTAHTAVGVQATEKTALVSQPMTVSEVTVDKSTMGGSVNLSWQDRDWTEPAVLDLLVSDLAGGYAQATDAAFCAELVAKVTQTVPVGGATPTSADWLTAIYGAAAIVFGAGNATPTTLWVAPDVWADLGAAVDAVGRPLFPAVLPQNAMGAIAPTALEGSVAGMRLAVDGNFPAGTAILGDSTAAEFFEQVGGMVSALEPTILGTAIAFYGYAATCIVRPNALVKLVP